MLEVNLDVEICSSDSNPSETKTIRAILCRSEELCQTPESSGKFDFIIPMGDGEKISIRANRSEFMRIIRFLEFGEPLDTEQQSSGVW